MATGALTVSDGVRQFAVRGAVARIILRLLDPELRNEIERPGQPRQVVFHLKDGSDVAAEVTRFYRGPCQT